MKLYTNSKNKSAIEAVEWAEKYLNSIDFEKDVLSLSKFDNSNVLPSEIVRLFKHFSDTRFPVEVRITNFGWIYRNVLGRTVGTGIVYVNSYGLDRQKWEVAATVVHETGHVVDEFYPKASFGHGSNSAKGKKLSFPYWIGERANNWIKREILNKESNRLSMVIALKRELA